MSFPDIERNVELATFKERRGPGNPQLPSEAAALAPKRPDIPAARAARRRRTKTGCAEARHPRVSEASSVLGSSLGHGPHPRDPTGVLSQGAGLRAGRSQTLGPPRLTGRDGACGRGGETKDHPAGAGQVASRRGAEARRARLPAPPVGKGPVTLAGVAGGGTRGPLTPSVRFRPDQTGGRPSPVLRNGNLRADPSACPSASLGEPGRGPACSREEPPRRLAGGAGLRTQAPPSLPQAPGPLPAHRRPEGGGRALRKRLLRRGRGCVCRRRSAACAGTSPTGTQSPALPALTRGHPATPSGPDGRFHTDDS